MLNGLSLFSGIGGMELALAPWVRPVLYCESDPYAQAVLVSLMRSGELPAAGIWNDVRTLRGKNLRGRIDIVFGGFPCQDISVAGLGGERSGLFYEVARLVREIRPALVFLENVPAIAGRGLDRVAAEISALRYDCRWGMLSAYDVGAPHLRERWFLLAHSHSNGNGREVLAEPDGHESPGKWALGDDADGLGDALSDSVGGGVREQSRRRNGTRGPGTSLAGVDGEARPVADASSERKRGSTAQAEPVPARGETRVESPVPCRRCGPHPYRRREGWWLAEPDVGRVAHGIPFRVDRIRCLGNACVPVQAREAFVRLLWGTR